jgi:hypothetical protein
MANQPNRTAVYVAYSTDKSGECLANCGRVFIGLAQCAAGIPADSDGQPFLRLVGAKPEFAWP